MPGSECEALSRSTVLENLPHVTDLHHTVAGLQRRSELGGETVQGRLLIGPQVTNLPHKAAEPQPIVRA